MKKIVAITSCPVGIAHTYMAAENLEKAGAELGVDIKVETHGSIGLENELSAKDIAEAVGVIIAADTKVDKSRFIGRALIECGVQEGIHQSKTLISRLLEGKLTKQKMSLWASVSTVA
ncbi:PTS fructose transporter subunit IIB [Streptococcus catagoni]|uniref:PTS fructose transporter subunit IIB n=1 Tax=Streptococcus catagoni TaxID=2654874 RepID=UPI0014087036|nr:PTS fructose transporter subunit IIB [Streptococcus catagoni]